MRAATLGNSLESRDIASVLHPFTNAAAHEGSGPEIITSGKGVYITDVAGKQYLDGMAGLWAVALGYSNERLIEAATRQLNKLPYYHTFASRSNEPSIELAERLIAMAPVQMSKVFFTSSGSEAVDTAFKIVWYYNNAIGRPEKRKIISRKRAYHGVNVASGSATGLHVVHAGFGLPVQDIIHTECPHYLMNRLDDESEDQFVERMAGSLERLIVEEDPATIAAFIAEPVMGAGGVIPPPEGYFDRVQEVLERYDILLIADEVICGFGRTGNMFGSETYGLKPDLMTMAKALSSGYQPIGAVMISDRLYRAIRDHSAEVPVFGHGYTYSGHPVCAAVALEAQKIYEETDILSHVRTVGAYFQERLRSFAEHPLVGEVRGVSLIAAIELVKDKASLERFQAPGVVGGFAAKAAYERGLVVRPLPGGDSLGLCPPLVITKGEVDRLAALLGSALDDTVEVARRHA